MNRYLVQPRTKAGLEQFVVLDTDYEPPREMGTYQNREAAIEQAMRYNRHRGTEVGAPITPDKPRWNPQGD